MLRWIMSGMRQQWESGQAGFLEVGWWLGTGRQMKPPTSNVYYTDVNEKQKYFSSSLLTIYWHRYNALNWGFSEKKSLKICFKSCGNCVVNRFYIVSKSCKWNLYFFHIPYSKASKAVNGPISGVFSTLNFRKVWSGIKVMLLFWCAF